MAKPAAQGDFIKELRESRGARQTSRDKFVWEKTMARPPVDTRQPDMSIPKMASTAKPAASTAKPTRDIPTTLSGQIDTAQIKTDLVAQLRAQRKR